MRRELEVGFEVSRRAGGLGQKLSVRVIFNRLHFPTIRSRT